jgi:hypothetical protein
VEIKFHLHINLTFSAQHVYKLLLNFLLVSGAVVMASISLILLDRVYILKLLQLVIIVTLNLLPGYPGTDDFKVPYVHFKD